jgi:sulfate permease, SulP family
MLALLVGPCFLLAWAARLGLARRLLPRPVLIGYIHGVAVVLVCGQLGKLLGIDIDATKPIGELVEAARELGDASLATVLVSATALVALLAARRLVPRLPTGRAAVAFCLEHDASSRPGSDSGTSG